MPKFRALAANAAFYINVIVWMLVCSPILLGPHRWAMGAIKSWAKSTMWLIRLTAGIKWEIRGLENIPRNPDGTMQGCIIACKHQSTWETFGLFPYLDNPAYILKQELMRIPLFGWYCARAGMIPVERSKSAQALRAMTKAAKAAVEDNRQLIIFPEGTRREVGAQPDYKSGTAHMYKQLAVPMVPAGLNAGLFWPRRQAKRFPGTLVISLLPAIAPGEDTKTVRAKLQSVIEAESARLVEEARNQDPKLPATPQPSA
jgi:1-acyl-sn-glycerol-3-phosphate acyltransferase